MKKRRKSDPLTMKMPRISKHRFLKAFILVSFIAYAGQLIFKKNDNRPPYNDGDNTTDTSGDITPEELELGKQAYAHLLSVLYTKCQNMGMPLKSGYLIKIVAYDYMNDSINVILQKGKNTAHLSFSSERLTDHTVELGTGTLADQISALANILDVPLLTVPVKTTLSDTLSSTLNNNVTTNVNHFARTDVIFSNGDLRTDNEEYGLLAGRDYYYFNVYGTGKKDGSDYNIATSVAMKADDTEILEVDNLLDYYIESPRDAHFVINMSYQEDLQTLKILNEQQSIFELEA